MGLCVFVEFVEMSKYGVMLLKVDLREPCLI